MTKKHVSTAELEGALLEAAHRRPTTAQISAVTVAPRPGAAAAGDWYVARFERAAAAPGVDEAGVARELDAIADQLREAYALGPPTPRPPQTPLL